MKKLVLSVFAMMFIASLASAEIGLGIKGGAGQDDNNWQSEFSSSNYSFDENNGFAGVEVLWQQGGLYGWDNSQIVGVKVGAEKRGELEYKDYDFRDITTNNIYQFTITSFYKYAPDDTQFNFWGGVGATIGRVKWEDKDMDSSYEVTQKNTLVYPHIKGGVEWRPTQLFGLGLDLGYNFGGNFKVGDIKRDIRGFEGALAARFYFE